MIDLIKQLEAATEGSRGLDAEIALFIGYTHAKAGKERTVWWRDPEGDRCGYDGFTNHPPKFTTSLDAALTLVPGGHEWRIWGDKAEIWQNGTPPTHFLSEAPTPALALCIAALKARNEGEGIA